MISLEGWAMIAVISAVIVISVLHCFAIMLEREVAMYRLALKTARLKRQYAERLARIQAGMGDADPGPVIEVDEAPAADPARQAA